jgi:undecaprenol kinase
MIHHTTLKNSFKYASAGVRHALENDQNFRVHLLAAWVVFIMGLFFQISKFEWIALLIMILLVLATEMINTAIENMVDLITREHREEAKIAKDVAGGMVLVTSVGSVIVGLVIFIPYILELF